MSIRPITYENGIYHSWDDAFSHDLDIPEDQVVYANELDNSPNYQTLIMKCVDCGSDSYHPIGGGASPGPVQDMFIRTVMRLGCPCGLMPAGASYDFAKSHVKMHTDNMDGKGRFQLDDPQFLANRAGESTSGFDIVYKNETQEVIGIGPFALNADFGPEFTIDSITDDNLYDTATKQGAKYNPLTKEFYN